ALGICGSGLIDLLAGLLDAGVIDWTGLIRVEARDSLPPALRDRVAMRGEERVFTVLRPGEAGARAEIVLTQDDVRQVQLAKGAPTPAPRASRTSRWRPIPTSSRSSGTP